MNYKKSINEVSDWCDKNAMTLHPAETEIMLLATRQNISFAHLSLILISKKVTLSKLMSTYTLALSSTMNDYLVGDSTLLAHVKQYQKYF